MEAAEERESKKREKETEKPTASYTVYAGGCSISSNSCMEML